MSQNVEGNIKVAVNEKKAPQSPKLLSSSFGPDWLEIYLPIRTISEANPTEHWRVRHKRHKSQKSMVALILRPHCDKLKLPCHIKLTRFAPRNLDRHDNLPMSMKYILDTCCAYITGDHRPGRADDDERITVSYDQVFSSTYGVKIHFQNL